MHGYLIAHGDWLVQHGVYLQDDIDELKRILVLRGPVGKDDWFYFPDCCQLAADTFLTPISFHSATVSVLFLPITNVTYASTKPIVLHLLSDHFKRIVYKRGARNITYPPVYQL